MTARIESLVDTPGYKLFVIEFAIVALGQRRTSLADVEHMHQAFEKLRLRRPRDRFGYLVVLEKAAGISMSADIRAALTRVMHEFQGMLHARAVVFEVSGFAASIVRSIAAALSVAARHECPTIVVASVPEGVRWLASKGMPAVSSDLVQIVQDARAQTPAVPAG
jgi:hypothetical protein